MFHVIGTNHEDDRCVYVERDISRAVSVRKTSDRQFIIVQINGSDSSESRYISMDDSRHKTVLIKKRVDGIFYTVDHGTNGFYMHTNDNAGRFRVLVTDNHQTSLTSVKSRWIEHIAEDPLMYLIGFSLTKNHIMLNYRLDGIPVIVVNDLRSGEKRRVSLPYDDESHVALGYSANYDDCDLRVDYSSLTRPDRTYRYDAKDNKVRLLKMLQIPSGLDSTQYACKRIFARP